MAGLADTSTVRTSCSRIASPTGTPDRLPGLAVDLVGRSPHIIVAVTPPAVRAALGATKTIPIVMITGDDPVRSGFVTSLARPRGNITGVALLVVDLFAKQMELLKQVVPHLGRVARPPRCSGSPSRSPCCCERMR